MCNFGANTNLWMVLNTVHTMPVSGSEVKKKVFSTAITCVYGAYKGSKMLYNGFYHF
jgi:hypothetical protein